MRPVGVDERHGALVQALRLEERVVDVGDHVDERVADAHHVEFVHWLRRYGWHTQLRGRERAGRDGTAGTLAARDRRSRTGFPAPPSRPATTCCSSPTSESATFTRRRRHHARRPRGHLRRSIGNAIELDVRQRRGSPTTDGDRVDVDVTLDQETERFTVTARRAPRPSAPSRSTSTSGARSTTSCAGSTARPTSTTGIEPVIATTPDAGHRLPAGLPVLGRARPQGGVRRDADRRRRTFSRSRTGPRSTATPIDGGRVRVTFADTMAMSTYLVAFVVGPLEATEPIDVDGMPLRIVHVPGKDHLTAFAQEIGAFALAGSSTTTASPTPARRSTSSPSPTSPPAPWRTSAASPSARRCLLRRSGDGHPGRGAARSPTSWPTSWPTCGSATSSRCAGGTASG